MIFQYIPYLLYNSFILIHSHSLQFSSQEKLLILKISLISLQIDLSIQLYGFIEIQSLSRKISTCSILFPSWTSILYSLFVCSFASALFRALIWRNDMKDRLGVHYTHMKFIHLFLMLVGYKQGFTITLQ